MSIRKQKEAQYCNIYKRSESSSEGETEKGGVGEGRRKVYIGHKSKHSWDSELYQVERTCK
jgi:hypothetical protein